MIKEAIGLGKDVVEAFENAKKALNAPETATVKQEVLEMPKGKTFGIFGKERPAKVRAFYEAPDPKPARPAKTDKTDKADKPARADRADKPERPPTASPSKSPKRSPPPPRQPSLP